MQGKRAYAAALGAASLIGVLGTAPAQAAAPGAGNGKSFTPAISRDGRYVAFASDASNLVAGDTNGRRDIFVRDTVAGTTKRVSVTASKKQANGASFWPAISDNGRYVSFISAASNLVAGDTNGQADGFRVDVVTGAVVRITVGAGGKQANGKSANLDMDATGTKLAFSSTASNLVAADTNGTEDVFLRDLTTGTTKRVSKTTAGGQLPVGRITGVSISPNAAYVGFVQYPAASYSDKGYEWDRASGSVEDLESTAEYYLKVRAGNYGVGFLAGAYSEGGHCDHQLAEAWMPDGVPLDVWLGECTGYIAWGGFDVNPGGSMMALQVVDGSAHSLYLYDQDLDMWENGPAGQEVAALHQRTNDPALAGNGKSVAFADSAGQIRKWVHATGQVTLISATP